MNEDSVLRPLIRLIPPARSLREEVEKSIHLELYNGSGDMAVRSYEGLHESVAKLAADSPYVRGLKLFVPEGSNDREKMSLVLLASSQLLAYLEGETGISANGNGRADRFEVQTAPRIELTDVHGLAPEALERIVAAAERKAE